MRFRLLPPHRAYSTASRNMLFTNHRTKFIDGLGYAGGHEVRPALRPLDLKKDVRWEYVRTSRQRTPQLETLPKLSNILKGFRTGELTIFTGPTGSGKTTVLSQISLDLAAQNMPILWGSFEVRNSRLIQAMLHQIAMEPIDLPHDEADNNSVPLQPSDVAFDRAYEQLNRLPIHLMDVFGSTPLEQVMLHMEEAVRTHGIQLVILDNLQFMLSGQGNGNFDKFDLVDQSIAAVRQFCNAHPVHVILVVHPRKEMDETPLGLCSVSGTAKATQEADNVVILQKLEGNHRFLDVKKNRFDGELGRVRIGFSRKSRMIYEMPDKQQQQQQEGSGPSPSGYNKIDH